MNEIVKASVNIDELGRVAKMLAMSQYFTRGADERSVAQIATQILAGQEMGLGPFASVQSIHVIQGKPTLAANLMASKVKSHPHYDYRVNQMEDEAVSVEFFQDGQSLGTSTFTRADAEKAGVWGKDNWGKYPRNMLFARALSNGVRWYCPDVFNGSAVYTPDELASNGDDYDVLPPASMDEVAPINQDGPVHDPDAEWAAIPDAAETDAMKWANIADGLSGACRSIAEKAYDMHINGDAPASDAQYKFLSGTLDKVSDGKHAYILSVLCRREVSGSNPCSKQLASKLLDYTLAQVPQTDENNRKVVGADGKAVYVDNPQYRQDIINCLVFISRLE
jgi:hypothetical protein